MRIVHQVGSWLLHSMIYHSFEISLEVLFHCRHIMLVIEISIFGVYDTDWIIHYKDLNGIPTIIPEKQVIRILIRVRVQDDFFSILPNVVFLLRILNQEKNCLNIEL